MATEPVDYWVTTNRRTKVGPYSYKVKNYNNIVFIICPSDVKQMKSKKGSSRSRVKCILCNKFLPYPGLYDEGIFTHFKEKHKGIKP